VTGDYSLASPVSPTISRIRTHNTRAASISVSTGSVALAVEAGVRRLGWLCLPADHWRFRAIANLGGFRSRVFGIDPQLGYIFPVANMTGFLGAKDYGEFDAANRPSGWKLPFLAAPADSRVGWKADIRTAILRMLTCRIRV
jgi:hypothetical protein